MVHRTPARLGRWFALTLALPAAFAILWAWLVPGGVVARAEEDERQLVERVLRDAVQAFEAAVRRSGREVEFVVRLDDERRIVAPFRVEPAIEVDSKTVGVAEQAATARLRAGEDLQALQFFGHAAERGELSAEGWLTYASTQSRRDPESAWELLRKAREQHAGAQIGPMPFALAALLVGARRPPDDVDVAALRKEFCQLVQSVPAVLVPTVLADYQESPASLDAQRAEQLVATADFLAAFASTSLPTKSVVLDSGDVGLPVDSSTWSVLPANHVAGLQAVAISHAVERHPEVAIDSRREGALAEYPAATTAQVWSARFADSVTPNSVVLQRAANGCLALALVTLVLGNLLLLRLTRRESQLVRLRANFVDVVSHELRTPLTALSLKSEMLASGDVPERRRDHYLHGLHQDVLRLNDQVERILDFGRLQKGAALRREPVPGRSLLAHGLRSGRPALRLVSQHVDVEVPRELPTIVGDVEVLGRALRNLLENAAKYAPAGSTVGVRAFAQAGELCVEITDQGPGVAAEERDSIFQPFVRGEYATSGTPGSGLGLALVAAAAAEHGGRVTVDERAGGGAIFTLHLPAIRAGGTA